MWIFLAKVFEPLWVRADAGGGGEWKAYNSSSNSNPVPLLDEKGIKQIRMPNVIFVVLSSGLCCTAFAKSLAEALDGFDLFYCPQTKQ